jgi:hypothetical protein
MDVCRLHRCCFDDSSRYVKDFKTMDDDLTQFIDLVASEQVRNEWMPSIIFGGVHSVPRLMFQLFFLDTGCVFCFSIRMPSFSHPFPSLL